MKNQESKNCQLNILNKITSNYVKISSCIYQLSNNKLVMPRHSKFLGRTKGFFFGISKNQFDKFRSNELFILFICGYKKIFFILPANELFWLDNYLPASDNSWKLIIKEESNVFYLYKYGKSGTKKCIHSYLNNFKLLSAEVEKLESLSKLSTIILTEEVTEHEKYYEGATTQIMVNIYERNPQARKKCLAKYGLDCSICGFNFEKVYGVVGKGFMQVHHLKPLSQIKEEYELNPINDLRPVCPNCHAMIHMRTPPYTPEEILSFIKASKQFVP